MPGITFVECEANRPGFGCGVTHPRLPGLIEGVLFEDLTNRAQPALHDMRRRHHQIYRLYAAAAKKERMEQYGICR